MSNGHYSTLFAGVRKKFNMKINLQVVIVILFRVFFTPKLVYTENGVIQLMVEAPFLLKLLVQNVFKKN